jgi:hypothetical protein
LACAHHACAHQARADDWWVANEPVWRERCDEALEGLEGQTAAVERQLLKPVRVWLHCQRRHRDELRHGLSVRGLEHAAR